MALEVIIEVEEVAVEVIEVIVDPNAAQTALDAAAAAQAALVAIQALIDGFDPGVPVSIVPFYFNEEYISGPQTFDLGVSVIPMVVVLNEGRFLDKDTEWTIEGNSINILYDSLEPGDKIKVNGFEGILPAAPEPIGDVGPDIGSDV